MIHGDIKRALDVVLANLAAENNIRVSNTNVRFIPTGSTERYIKASCIPSLTAGEALGGDLLRLQGLYQMDITIPVNVGTVVAEDIARELNRTFKQNRVYEVGGNSVMQINPLHQTGGTTLESVFILHTWFNYRADVSV